MSTFETASLLIALAAVFSFINFKFIKMPATIGVMMLSVATSVALILLGTVAPPIRREAQTIVSGIDFHRALFDGMLAFLLFAGSLQLEANDLRREWKPIAVLSLLGTLVSTALVGGLCYFAFRGIGLPLPFVWCLVFGALISPTDPIAVLGIMRKVGAPKSLETIMAGESLFNDGIGVAIFLAIVGIVAGGHAPSLGQGIVILIREAAGGAGIGLAAGLIVYALIRMVDNYQVEVLLTLALAMGAYSIANAIESSGPIAAVVAGIFMGNRGRALGMSEKTRQHLDSFWELIDEILNAMLFLLVGLEVLVFPFNAKFVVAGLITIGIVLLCLWLSVAGSFGLLSIGRSRPHPGRITVLTWGGLRGGLSVAMALSLPEGEERNLILVVTYSVVIFCVFVQGLTAAAVIKRATKGDCVGGLCKGGHS